MKESHIRQVFTNYLQSQETQTAILLNGKWGCGKTYFWHNDLSEIAEKCGIKPIYISLNGLNNIENLENNFLINFLPVIGNSKFLKTIGKLVHNFANAATKLILKSKLDDLFKNIKFENVNFSKYIICYDDLERCQIDIKSIFGFINYYVEHKSLKTIIITDETKIDNGEANNYNKIKEKIIERVLNYEPDFNSLYFSLIKKYQPTEFYNFLDKNVSFITDIFISNEQTNLRNFKFILECLKEIFHSCEPSKIDKVNKELILFTTLISFEFKKGNLVTSNYNDDRGLSDLSFVYFNLTKPKENDNKEEVLSYAEQFVKSYLSKGTVNYHFYWSIYKYILTGFLNKDALLNEINSRIPEELPIEYQAYNKLIDYKFRGLDNEDFGELVNEVLKFAENGNYEIYNYVHISRFFTFFIDNGLVNIPKNEFNKIIENGLKKSKEKNRIDEWTMENIMHFEGENIEEKKIMAEVKKIHNELKENSLKKKAVAFIDALDSSPDILVKHFKEHEVSSSIFFHMDVELLFNKIISSKNKNLLDFNELLKHRYKAVNIGEFLFQDYNNLLDLQNKIDTYLETQTNIGQPKKFQLETLSMYLTDICNHLKKTQKP